MAKWILVWNPITNEFNFSLAHPLPAAHHLTHEFGAADALTSYVPKSLYDVQTILAATLDDTPAALLVPEQTLVGRITLGNIAALSAAQVKTLLAIAEGDVTGLVADLAGKAPTVHGHAEGDVVGLIADLGDKVDNSLFDAQSILAATLDDTPAALIIAEQQMVGRITGGNVAALSAAQVKTLLAIAEGDVANLVTDLGNKVDKSLYDAESILAAVLDNTPAALTVAEQTLIGRITGGNIAALTAAQVNTLLGLAGWGNLDGGTPTSTYGGVTPIDCGGAS